MSSARLTESDRGSDAIRAVLFDVDGTLYSQWPIRLFMAAELLALVMRWRSYRRAARVWEGLKTFRRVREEIRDAKGDLLTLQYVEAARRLGGDAGEIEAWVSEWMHQRPLKYLRFGRRAGVTTTIRRLQGAGLRTGVLSDYPAADKLAALGLADRFSVVLCTTDPVVNAFKPRADGFLKACELWGLQPSEVVYVGDRPDVDAAGALASGMRCVIVSPTERLRHLFRSTTNYPITHSFRSLHRAIDRCR